MPAVVRVAVDQAGVPKRYRDCTFDNFQPRAGTENMVDAARAYASTFANGSTVTGLYLAGPVGTGKTHIAVATSKSITARTLTPFLFVSVNHLLTTMRGDFDGDGRAGHDLHRRACTARLLVLDDIAQERVSEWGRDQIYGIVDARYQRELPTLITSNSADAQLRALFGPAMVSRLYEMTQAVRVEAGDFRAELAKRGAA